MHILYVCETHRDAKEHGVHRLPEGQRLWILPVQRLQSGHQCLPQFFRLKD